MALYILLTLGAFVLSSLCGFIFIPQILSFCKKRELYDIPNARKVHANAIPRLGGMAFLPSLLIASVITLFVLDMNDAGEKIKVSVWVVYFSISMMLVYGVGLIDDIIGLGPKTKFTVQIIAACFLPMSGLYINNLYGFCGIHELSYLVGAPLTVLVITFIVNAMNLIDGIDGLCGGLTFLTLSGFLYCFMREDLIGYCIIISGLMGVLVPFLYFNLLGNPEKNTKIFMGDSGSLTLGFILGTLFVKFSMNNPNVMQYRTDSLLLSFTLLIVPVCDVFRVSLVRLRTHKPLFGADQNHIHHKLMCTGLSQHQTLAVILTLALAYIILNSILIRFIDATYIVAIDIVIFIAFNLTVDHFIRKRQRIHQAEAN